MDLQKRNLENPKADVRAYLNGFLGFIVGGALLLGVNHFLTEPYKERLRQSINKPGGSINGISDNVRSIIENQGPE